MTNDDDTICTDKQSHEDVLLAMLDAGALPGIGRASMEDVASLPGSALVIARVSHDCFEGTPEEMVAYALSLRERLLAMPEQGRGRTILSFDGWANDARPLFEVPEVFVFCRALLFGIRFGSVSSASECALLARPLLDVLFDERAAWDGDPDPRLPPTSPIHLEIAGSLWLTGHAFAPDVYGRDPSSPTGFYRNIGANLHIDDALRGKR
jgi:hypothetical protein